MRLQVLFALFQFLILQLAVADGAGGGTGQFCRIDLGKDLYMMFSAYTPEISATQRYCTEIPHVGVTDITLDFESYELRGMEVGFKMIDKQTGKVIFEEPPRKIKGGVFTTRVNFEKPGHYDMFVVVTLPDGSTLDKHVHILVREEGQRLANTLMVLVVLFAVFYFVYLSSASFRQRVDSVIALIKRF